MSVIRCNRSVFDSTAESLLRYFKPCIEFIDQSKHHGSILVHCLQVCVHAYSCKVEYDSPPTSLSPYRVLAGRPLLWLHTWWRYGFALFAIKVITYRSTYLLSISNCLQKKRMSLDDALAHCKSRRPIVKVCNHFCGDSHQGECFAAPCWVLIHSFTPRFTHQLISERIYFWILTSNITKDTYS